MTKYIVHVGTGTVIAADEAVIVEIVSPDLDDDAIVEIARAVGYPVIEEI